MRAGEIKLLLARMGYMADSPAGAVGHVHYCSKWRDKWHGVLVWEEQNVDSRWDGQRLELHGLIAIIERLEYRLQQQLEH
jgi:hypothetical protein